MKFVYYNDTGRIVNIHRATQIHGTECDMSPIKPLEERVFILPEGSYPWVKMWDYKEIGLSILVSPTMDDNSDGKPKHIGKYIIEFSYTSEESGKKVLDYCNHIFNYGGVDEEVQSMLKIIAMQVEGYLKKTE